MSSNKIMSLKQTAVTEIVHAILIDGEASIFRVRDESSLLTFFRADTRLKPSFAFVSSRVLRGLSRAKFAVILIRSGYKKPTTF